MVIKKRGNIMNIEKRIQTTNEKNVNKINWTKAWSGKYPILSRYQEEVDVVEYRKEIRKLLSRLEEENHYSKLDAMLVLKDIMYHEWKDNK